MRKYPPYNRSIKFSKARRFRAPDSIRQKSDFLWREGGEWHLGDAKWKLLGQTAPVFGTESDEIRRGKAIISPDDARQMSVYSEILKRREKLENSPPVTIFYPLLEGLRPMIMKTMWNGADLRLRPVRVRDFGELGTVLG